MKAATASHHQRLGTGACLKTDQGLIWCLSRLSGTFKTTTTSCLLADFLAELKLSRASDAACLKSLTVLPRGKL